MSLVLSGILLFLVALMYGALVELQQQLIQVRKLAGFVDESRPLPFNRMATLSYLLASLEQDVETINGRFLVFVLSDSCATCADIAARLATVDAFGWIALVESGSADGVQRWTSSFGVRHGQVWIHDAGGGRAGYLGVSMTPAVVQFEQDVAVDGRTLPSIRQAERSLDWLLSKSSGAYSYVKQSGREGRNG